MSRPGPTTGVRRRLTIAVGIAILLPGAILPMSALAQTAKEKELEARVMQLEAQVKALLDAQQQQQGAISQTRTELQEVRTAQTSPTAAPAPAPATAGAPGQPPAQPIQTTSITPQANAGTAFSYGGFIKLDAMVTDTGDGKIVDGNSGRLFYNPQTIPVVATPGAARPDTHPYSDVHAQFSRFWFSADHVTDSGQKVKAYIEADMYGGGNNALGGNETVSNTYAVSLRHAYVSWGNWLAGQTWSNFMDAAALPDAVDFVGPTDGTVFVRQAQVRYTNGPWSFSVENPQTTITSFQNAQPRYNSGDNVMPDLTGRWLTKGDWGHFTIAGLLRQFKNGSDTATGGALSVSGKYNIGDSDDIRYAVNGGRGIGRYLGFGIGTDVVRDATGVTGDATPGSDLGGIHAITGYGGFVGWRHMFSPKLRGNLMYAANRFNNDEKWTGGTATKGSQSVHANLIYSPFPKLDVGTELTWGERELENQQKGDLKRIQTSVKYSF